MTHFKQNECPNACIFGSHLAGKSNKFNPQRDWVKLSKFSCEVVDNDDICKHNAKASYNVFELHGDISDSISGTRGIVEPVVGYSGPPLRSKSKTKPAKGGRHTPFFQVTGIPAVCYYDTIETAEKRQTLSKIRLTCKS